MGPPRGTLGGLRVERRVASESPTSTCRGSEVREMPMLAPFLRDEDGQGLAEYALILVLIAIVAIVALALLGGQISTMLNTVGASV